MLISKKYMLTFAKWLIVCVYSFIHDCVHITNHLQQNNINIPISIVNNLRTCIKQISYFIQYASCKKKWKHDRVNPFIFYFIAKFSNYINVRAFLHTIFKLKKKSSNMRK